MGLDPEGSYIIVISGENLTAPASPGGASTYNLNPLPGEDQAPGDGNNTVFQYIYNGQTYWMRFVTVIATGYDTRTVTTSYMPTNPDVVSYFLDNLFPTFISAADELIENIPLGSIALLLSSIPDDYIFAEIPPGMPTIRATTNWNSNFIQVLDEENQRWTTAHSAEYTITEVVCIRTLTAEGGTPDTKMSQPKYLYNYSRYYFDEAERKRMAMEAYDHYTIYYDSIQQVYLYLGTSDGVILFETEGEPLMIHHRNLIPHLPNTPVE